MTPSSWYLYPSPPFLSWRLWKPPPTPHGHLPASSCSRSGTVIKTRVDLSSSRSRVPSSASRKKRGTGGREQEKVVEARLNFSLLPILCRNLIKAATRSATSFRRSAAGSSSLIISCLYYRHRRAITNRLMPEKVIRRPCKNTALSSYDAPVPSSSVCTRVTYHENSRGC